MFVCFSSSSYKTYPIQTSDAYVQFLLLNVFSLDAYVQFLLLNVFSLDAYGCQFENMIMIIVMNVFIQYGIT